MMPDYCDTPLALRSNRRHVKLTARARRDSKRGREASHAAPEGIPPADRDQ